MNAQQARDTAKSVNTQDTSKGLSSARSAIEKGAKSGAYSVFIYDRLSDDAKAILKTEGFKLREWEDQRDGYGCEITWK